MKRIKLTQGKFVLIDDRDFEKIRKFKWCAEKFGNTYCAMTNVRDKIKKRQKHIKMHRLIMSLDFGDKRCIDHINSNGLDNRRVNLRICTHQMNCCSQKISKHSSKYKGVYWYKFTKKWKAQICINYRKKHLGYFNSEIEAGRKYNEVAKKYFGDYAKLNEID